MNVFSARPRATGPDSPGKASNYAVKAKRDTAGYAMPERGALLWLGAICLLGLLIRLALYFAIWNNGGNPLLGDEGNYVDAALSLAAGHGIPDTTLWIRPPGFFFVAAAVFRLTGNSLQALNLLQIAFSILSIALLFVLTRIGLATAGYSVKIATRTALIAAILLALNPSLILSSLFFLSETLFVLLVIVLALLLALLLRPQQRHKIWLALAAGLVGGAALLVRANSLTFLAPFALLILLRLPGNWKQRLAPTLLFGLGILLVLAPWTIRNAFHYQRFLPLETTGQYNLYLDNNDLGRKAVDAQLWEIENPADRGGVAGAAAWAWISSHPSDFAARVATRFVASVTPDDFTEAGYPLRDKIPGSDAIWHDLFSLGATLGYLLLVGVALIGWLAARRGVLWWLTTISVGVYVLTAGLTHNEFRFRLQLFPLLTVFAALALAQPSVFVHPTRAFASVWQRWSVLAGVALTLVWVIMGLPNIAAGVAKSWQTQSYLATASGSGAQALAAAKAAAELNPTSGAIWRRYAMLLVAANLGDQANTAFKHALNFEPGDYQTRALYAAYLRQQDTTAAAKIVSQVPPTFNLALQTWAWNNIARAPAQPLDVGGDDLGLTQGFFPAEQDPGGFSYRWAGDLSLIRLPRPAGAGTLVFNANPLPMPTGSGRPVQIMLGGDVLADLTLDPGWHDYSVELPDASSAGEIVITFKTTTQVASEQDPRLLSFALNTASINSP